ncbi:MerR family transcriptional regulator [Streptomyces hoynatensis]|uniref:MerR family transcriptional regulator n=1 Tax=Streptomyces hoynatensis TaxID=1141874 RepID=A0A3A9ZG92_9ACTN|nr:MerR family transcriptional regulator [Streptomyces hoynatensis]
MAKASGLPVSALRFYDGAGVLAPDWVDPASGYRWYGPGRLAEARLLARLRGAGMPLSDIRLLLASLQGRDDSLARSLLDAHRRRLRTRLAEAEAELSAVHALLDSRESPMTPPTAEPTPARPTRLSAGAAELAAALDSVRFAVGTDPELPALGGVLFDFDASEGRLRLVATDRYRLAQATVVPAGHEGPAARALVPTPLAEAMRALLAAGPGREADAAELAVEGELVTLRTAGRTASGRRLPHEFPDYRRLVALPEGRSVTVDAPALGAAVRRGPVLTERREQDGEEFPVTVLTLTPEGELAVAADPARAAEKGAIAVNRHYFLQAIDAAAHDRLVLQLGEPTTPLAIRVPTDEERRLSILMPVRLSA